MDLEFTQFGRYLLLRKIAVGGMAEIHLAKQSGLAGFEKLVVLKRILPDFASDDDFVQMFLDEARLAASLQHPNVVQVFDLDKVGATFYIAMEYVPGQDLSRVLRTCRKTKTRLPPTLLARILVGACEGLHYAHTLKDRAGAPLHLVHRDVTPSNLLIAYEGATKVLDFGVAKAETQLSRTAAGAQKGKYPYMAPEQLRNERLDARADVWSLGVLLWEALTGQRLFQGDNEMAVMHGILKGPIPHPTDLAPETPPPLDAVAMKALQRDRDRRYPTAQAMQRDLEALLRGVAAPVTTLEVSAYLKQVFRDEYSAHEKLLSEVPSASPEHLAALVQRVEPSDSGFGEDSSPWSTFEVPGGPAMTLDGRIEGSLDRTAAGQSPVPPPVVGTPRPQVSERFELVVGPAEPSRPPAAEPAAPPEAPPEAPPAAIEPARRGFRLTGGAAAVGFAAILALGAVAWWFAQGRGASASGAPAVAPLRVETTPEGAKVSIGGEALGETPYVCDNKYEGATVLVELPGYEPRTARVGGGMWTIRLMLTPKQGAGPPPVAKPAKSPAPRRP